MILSESCDKVTGKYLSSPHVYWSLVSLSIAREHAPVYGGTDRAKVMGSTLAYLRLTLALYSQLFTTIRSLNSARHHISLYLSPE